MDRTSAALASIDKFFSEFTTVKRAVIRSKSLRLPELIVTVTLLLGVLAFKVVYKLYFLAEVPFLVTARTPFSPTYSNWWHCEIQAGTCKVDVPSISDAAYCTLAQWQRYWDIDSAQYRHKLGKIPCKHFDKAVDQKEVSGSLRISTRVVNVIEKHTPDVGWELVKATNDRHNQHLLVGGEQMVELDGELPSGLGVHRLMELQGFIRYNGEDELRVIRCASKGKWLPYCPHVPYGKYWAENYKAVSGSTDAPVPELSYNGSSTGCVEVVDDHLYCHVSELLRAAGISLDVVGDGRRVPPRVSGLTLEIKLKVENWNSNDFWREPISLKPRFVIEVQCKGSGAMMMYSSYTVGSNPDVRTRTDHFGITLSLSPVTSWAEFSMLRLLGVLVVAMGAVRYANYFVTGILIAFYKWAGCVHVSALYEYNARQPSPTEAHVQQCSQAQEFLERHRAVEAEFLKELFRRENCDEEQPQENIGGQSPRRRRSCEKVDSVTSISSGSESDSSERVQRRPFCGF